MPIQLGSEVKVSIAYNNLIKDKRYYIYTPEIIEGTHVILSGTYSGRNEYKWMPYFYNIQIEEPSKYKGIGIEKKKGFQENTAFPVNTGFKFYEILPFLNERNTLENETNFKKFNTSNTGKMNPGVMSAGSKTRKRKALKKQKASRRNRI